MPQLITVISWRYRDDIFTRILYRHYFDVATMVMCFLKIWFLQCRFCVVTTMPQLLWQYRNDIFALSRHCHNLLQRYRDDIFFIRTKIIMFYIQKKYQKYISVLFIIKTISKFASHTIAFRRFRNMLLNHLDMTVVSLFRV